MANELEKERAQAELEYPALVSYLYKLEEKYWSSQLLIDELEDDRRQEADVTSLVTGEGK